MRWHLFALSVSWFCSGTGCYSCMLQGIGSACKMVRGSLNGLTFLAFLSLFSLSSKERKLWCLSHATGMTRRTNSKHSVQLSFIYILHTLPFIFHLEAITVPSLCFMLQGEGPAISETNSWLPYGASRWQKRKGRIPFKQEEITAIYCGWWGWEGAAERDEKKRRTLGDQDKT